MNPKLFDKLIETSIAPIAKWERVGDILKVRVDRPNASNPDLERIQRGAKFDLHIMSPNIIQNLELHGIEIPEDVRSNIIREIRSEALEGFVSDVDANGVTFDPELHRVDIDGNRVLTKFDTFAKKTGAKPITKN